MADEMKIPDFNLGDEFSEGGESFQPKPPEKSETAKPKPKLLFDDEESDGDKGMPQIKKNEPKIEESDSSDGHNIERAKPAHQAEGKKPKHIWLWLIPVLVIIIAGGSFFLQTKGYFDFSTVFVEAGKIKDKIFGASDTLTAQVTDTVKKTEPAAVSENSFEKEFLRKPENAKTETKSATAKPDVKTEVSKVETKKEPEKKPNVKPTAASGVSKTTGKFSIQISAWKMKSKAESELRKVKSKGVEAKLVSVSLPQKGGVWYRVMVGNYQSNEDAKRDIDRIKRVTGSENCIIREN